MPFGCIQCEAVDPADVAAIATTVKRALATYGTPALIEMIQNCMAQDLSWKVISSIWARLWFWLHKLNTVIWENVGHQVVVKGFFSFLVFWNNPWGLTDDVFHSMQGPAKKWEQLLLGLEVADSEPGIDGEEIAPQAKENVATP